MVPGQTHQFEWVRHCRRSMLESPGELGPTSARGGRVQRTGPALPGMPFIPAGSPGGTNQPLCSYSGGRMRAGIGGPIPRRHPV